MAAPIKKANDEDKAIVICTDGLRDATGGWFISKWQCKFKTKLVLRPKKHK